MKGETVYVISRDIASEDRFGNPTFNETREKVDNVLVDVMQSAEFVEPGRWETSENSITLHFPKTYNVSLYGKFIELRNALYKVVGDPMWLTPTDTPTPWNYPVKVERIDG